MHKQTQTAITIGPACSCYQWISPALQMAHELHSPSGGAFVPCDQSAAASSTDTDSDNYWASQKAPPTALASKASEAKITVPGVLTTKRAEMALCETQNTDTMISELFKSGQMANTLVRQLVNRWYCNETSIRCREIMEKQGILKEALHRSEIKNDILSNALCSIFCMSWKVSERQRRRAMLGELLIGYFDELLDAEASVPEDLSSREMPKQRNCRELIHCLSNLIRDCCFNNNLNMERRKGHHSPSRSRMRSKRAEDDARARSKRRGKRSRTRHSKRRSRRRSERCRRKRSAMPRSARNSEEEERNRDFWRFLKDEEDDWNFLRKATRDRKF